MNNTADLTLVGQKEYPAISILIPTHPQYPKFKVDREHMISLLNDAELQLRHQFSKQKADQMMERLHETVNGINYNQLSKGLAIYVSPHHEKVIHLPFEVTEKVIVDDSFEVRDLVYAAKLNRQYLVVIISQNKVMTTMGYGGAFIPVKYKDMPDNVKDVVNSHSFPGWDYLDTKAYEEKNIQNYLHFIDEVIEKAIRNTDFPVIMMGDTKLLGYIRNNTSNAKRIIGYVEGNYERISTADLRKKVEPFLNNLSESEESKAMDLLGGAVSKNTFAGGLSEVWRAAAEGRARLLLVEKDYRQSAHLDEDGFTLIVEDQPANPYKRIADAVDDIIELVLKNNGDVMFVDNGKLAAYQRIAVVTRY